MVWDINSPQGNEAAKVKWDIVEYTAGRGLDLGCGLFKTFPHFIGVDNGHHWGKQGVDVMVDTCEDLSIFADNSMDFIFSSHLLEHISDYEAALKEWWRVIKHGGYLILYLPHKEYYPNIGQPGANPDHKNDFMPVDIKKAMLKLTGNWSLLVNEERNAGNEYSFFQVYKKGGQGKGDFSKVIELSKQARLKAAVVRYGAFGDAIQASSVIAGLKRLGYHVTFYTAAQGYEVTKHDPHIDKFVVQGNDQVPNHELGQFWAHLAKKYDKFVNLSESVERSLLALPNTTQFNWSQEMRHKYLDCNYLQFQHDIADLNHATHDQLFYATDDEIAWAKKQYEVLGGYVVLWSLSGSAIHKVYPWMDEVIAKLLLQYPDLKVVLVGGKDEIMLQQGWEGETRVVKRAGAWTMRESMAFAQVADMVIGSETGLLNAVAFEPNGKIVLLSHSSAHNLTRDWENTIALEPEHTPCYPCHQMHYSFDTCTQYGTSGVALCQANISVDQVMNAFYNLEGILA